jgi:excisionase family DNA binding protein
MTSDKLITVDQAAEILALRPTTIRGMVQQRALPVVRPAGRRAVRFRLSDILRLAQLAVPAADGGRMTVA